MNMTNTTIREINIASNATVGDKMCPARSVRPMLLTTATVDGAKVADERDGRRQDVACALREADVADDCDGRRSKDCDGRRSKDC